MAPHLRWSSFIRSLRQSLSYHILNKSDCFSSYNIALFAIPVFDVEIYSDRSRHTKWNKQITRTKINHTITMQSKGTKHTMTSAPAQHRCRYYTVRKPARSCITRVIARGTCWCCTCRNARGYLATHDCAVLKQWSAVHQQPCAERVHYYQNKHLRKHWSSLIVRSHINNDNTYHIEVLYAALLTVVYSSIFGFLLSKI